MIYTKAKNIKSAYEQYDRSSLYTLDDCYSSCSAAKRAAMRYCVDLFIKYDGADMRIIGYNSMTFSVGFMGVVDGKNAFIYITKDYDRYIFLEDLEG